MMVVGTEAELVAARQERVDAMVTFDGDVLDRVLSDDFEMVHALNAVTDTKASLIERLRSGTLRYSDYATEEQHVRLFGEAALLAGVARVVVLAEEREFPVRVRYTEAWIRGPRGWQMVSWQGTALPREG